MTLIDQIKTWTASRARKAASGLTPAQFKALHSRSRQHEQLIREQKRQIRHLELVVGRLTKEYRPQALKLPPEALRLHVGRVTDMANFLRQGLDSSDRVREVFGDEPDGPVLDWGCGSGRTLNWLRGRGRWDEQYRGCDVDAEAIAWLRAQGVSSVQVCSDEPSLPFGDGELSGVFSFSVLTHIHPSRHRAWYEELHRVLRPGAIAYLTVHSDENMKVGKAAFTDDERGAYFEQGWSYSTRDGHYKDAATVTRAFTLNALEGLFEVQQYRVLGYHSMDDIVARRL